MTKRRYHTTKVNQVNWAQIAEQAGLEHERAADLAVAIANHMRAYWGGQLINFPKGQAIDIEQRDKEMWHDFNGTNHQVLAEKYRLAVPVVYKRLRLVRESLQASNQPDLFNT